MNHSTPHYLLYSDLSGDSQSGRWRFMLRSNDGTTCVEATDFEPDARGERLELLTVVRGLEALEQPARVTLVTSSIHVREGIRHGILEWRKNGWRWECFGQMVPVKNLDLWLRIDRAMRYHQIDCRTFRFDPPHRVGASTTKVPAVAKTEASNSIPLPGRLEWRLKRVFGRFQKNLIPLLQEWRTRLAQVWALVDLRVRFRWLDQ